MVVRFIENDHRVIDEKLSIRNKLREFKRKVEELRNDSRVVIVVVHLNPTSHAETSFISPSARWSHFMIDDLISDAPQVSKRMPYNQRRADFKKALLS